MASIETREIKRTDQVSPEARHEAALVAFRAADDAVLAEVARLRGLGWTEAQIDAHAAGDAAGNLPEPWATFSAAYAEENAASLAIRQL
jgi:hypothetical protein